MKRRGSGSSRARGATVNAVRRATVGLVVLAAGTAGAQDLLVLRDGSRRTGALQSCVADRCHLDGRPVERADIAWIGLAAAGDAPPPAVDPQLDEVHLVDGSTELGRVVGISLGVSDAFDRLQRLRLLLLVGDRLGRRA